MKRMVTMAAVVGLTGALALSGCGKSEPAASGTSSTTASTAASTAVTTTAKATGSTVAPSSAPIAKAEFITKADKICRDANAKVSNNPKTTTPADIESWVTTLVASNRAQMAEVQALGVPEPGAAEFTEIVALHKKLYDDIEANKAALAQDFKKIFDPTLNADKEALLKAVSAFGLKECGNVV